MERKSHVCNPIEASEDADKIKTILNEELLLVTRRLEISRGQFADLLSRQAKRTVTEAMIRNWVSPSQRHEIPLWAFLAWYRVVRNRVTLDKVLSLMGLTSKTGEEAEMIGLARQIIQRERLSSEIGIRMAALNGREESAA